MAYKTLPPSDENDLIIYAETRESTTCTVPNGKSALPDDNADRTLLRTSDGKVYKNELIADPNDPTEFIKDWVYAGTWGEGVKSASVNGGIKYYPDSEGNVDVIVAEAVEWRDLIRFRVASPTEATVLDTWTNAFGYPVKLRRFQWSTYGDVPTTDPQYLQVRNSAGSAFTGIEIQIAATAGGDYTLTYDIGSIVGAKISDPNVTYEIYQYKKIGAGAYDSGTLIGEIGPSNSRLSWDVTADSSDTVYYKAKHRVKASGSIAASAQTTNFSNEVTTPAASGGTVPTNQTLAIADANQVTVQPGEEVQFFWTKKSGSTNGGLTGPFEIQLVVSQA